MLCGRLFAELLWKWKEASLTIRPIVRVLRERVGGTSLLQRDANANTDGPFQRERVAAWRRAAIRLLPRNKGRKTALSQENVYMLTETTEPPLSIWRFR